MAGNSPSINTYCAHSGDAFEFLSDDDDSCDHPSVFPGFKLAGKIIDSWADSGETACEADESVAPNDEVYYAYDECTVRPKST